MTFRAVTFGVPIAARTAIVAAALLLAFGGTARAQSAEPVATPAAPDADKAAIAAIIMSSVAEVQLCDLAAQKTENVDVRSFCRSVANDHSRTALAGMQLAQRLGANDVKLQPSPGTPELIDTLAAYSGHAFDRALLIAQIEHHENDQETIRYAAEVAVDSSVKRYEQSVLPKVEKFLHLAEGALHSISEDQP